MTVAFILVIASALLGLVSGLFFRVSVLVLLTVLIATISAIALHTYGFGFAAGVSITVGCLVICQITYIAASILMSGSSRTDGLMQHEIDDDPDRSGKHDVRSEDE